MHQFSENHIMWCRNIPDILFVFKSQENRIVMNYKGQIWHRVNTEQAESKRGEKAGKIPEENIGSARVDVLYISIRSHDDPPVFPPPRGYPSQAMPSDHRSYQQAAPGVNGQPPGPAVIDCICVVYTLGICRAPPLFGPFNWTAF